jgi:predicted RNA-binding Zn-ribbon protein involved in translation (DUF1610 family)
METGFIAGYIDEDINYCPYCGSRLDSVNLYAETYCPECRRAFLVIGGEE